MIKRTSYTQATQLLALIFTTALFIFALTNNDAAAHGALLAQSKSRITIASAVRLREAPSVGAAEVSRLQIGTVVSQLERSAAKEKIGGAEDYWYRISTPDGKEGWLFGSFTAAFDATNRYEIYKRIADERLKIENLSFTDATDLARFLASAAGEANDANTRAALELARLKALQRAGVAVPTNLQNQSPYKEWLKANEQGLAFSEPSGGWLVKSDLFWELQKKYAALPFAEQIAWEGAMNPLPGECEGDWLCEMHAWNRTMGVYVSLYPRGAHTEEAMDRLIEILKDASSEIKPGQSAPPPGEEIDRQILADTRKAIAEARAVAAKTASAKRSAALQLLAKLSAHYGR
ncbi:MAG TPA: SH3 domain-containing protein [Blastocatellia bacterium]|nr:SH3 domain-containing protein [Blastocatellia bacterium]